MSVERWAWGSVAINVVLAALHGLLAAISGSLGVTAELIHNVADLLAAAAVLVGLKLAARKSRAFPYGLYKVENLVAAGLAGMVFFTAYEIVLDALLGAAGPVRVDWWMLGVLIATLGWDLLADAMRVPLDASLDAETLGRIRAVIDSDPAVADVRWVIGRNAGRFRFVEAGVVLRGGELTKVEAAVPRIEAAVRAAVRHVERVLVHVEPAPSASIRYAVPLADAGGTVSPHFGGAPNFALVTVRRADDAVEAHEIIGNPWQGEERVKGIRVAEWLVALKIGAVLLKADLQGKGPAYVLRDAGVEQRRIDAGTLSEALASVRSRSRLHG